MRGKNQWFPLLKNIYTSFKFSPEGQMEDSKTPVTEDWEFQYRDEILKRAIIGNSDWQLSKARNKIDESSIEKVLSTKMFLLETFIKKTRPIVLSDKWWRVSITRKIKNNRYSRKFWTIRSLMERTKATVLHLNTPPEVFCFKLCSWLRNSIHSGWGIQVWKLTVSKKIALFWISDSQDSASRKTNHKISHQKTF